MISSILSPFWAIFVTRRKNMINVMQYLLRFITVLRLHAQVTSFFEKKLKLDWRYSFPRSKKSNGSRNLHRAHFMRGHLDCQAIDGEFVKSRDKCPLLSTRVTKKTVPLIQCGRMKQLASTAPARETTRHGLYFQLIQTLNSTSSPKFSTSEFGGSARRAMGAGFPLR
jgi:hypothetical protein